MGQKPAVQTKARTSLARWRVRRGLTQRQVAEAAGVSVDAYRRLEWGRVSSPSIPALMSYAAILDCPLDDLLADVGAETRLRAASVEKPVSVDDGDYVRAMGRGQGNLQAAGIRRKADVLWQIPTYQNLFADAMKGDFAPFLDKAQEPDSDVVNPLLDGMVTQSVCMAAATQAKERLKRSLALRVRAAGITDADVVDGIIDLATSAATEDLRCALHAHVEAETGDARWRPLTGPEFEVQADAAVVNRVAQALGKPVDVALFAGTLVSRRRR